MEILVNPLVSRLVDTLSNLTSERLHLILGVPEEIQKLQETLYSIQDVLVDAEQRQITDRSVKRWLSRLTDVMYDADDILDEYRIAGEDWSSREHPTEEHSLSFRMLSLSDTSRQVLRSAHDISFTDEIGSKIRDLNLRLQEIFATRSTLDLRVSDRRREVTRVGRQTSPEVEPDIVGEAIKKDTRDLVDLLIKEKEDSNSNVVVLAIVGIGGIGKTTLAQKIFNNDKIKDVFQKTIWVCVSQELVETDLLREIITSAGGSPGEARSKAQLESKVKDALKDSKFLLVLDDVWHEQIWEDLLRIPLQIGAAGSRVLVTTRNQTVAVQMKAIHSHTVNLLPLDDSWLLLCKKATKNAEEERDAQNLKDIGMKIVEKCQGLPLAIKVIGGLLRGKLSRWQWLDIERRSAWSRTGLPDGVHQALYLSYQDLPSYLKPCFLYCSLFREDTIFSRGDLVRLWIAEGFIVDVEGEEYPSLEAIAEGYYDELVQRSLLHTRKIGGMDWYTYCTLHDLLRSLCHFLTRGESSVIRDMNKHTADDDSMNLRRLSIVAPKMEHIKPLLHSLLAQRYKSVRTFLVLERSLLLDEKDVEDCFNNLRRLRVVYLASTSIQSLTETVGNLLHLRYLNLSNCTRMKTLPESIANLKYLQFLNLKGCTELQTLPKGVVKLCHLRALNLNGVPLKELPSGIARLEHLNVLTGAVVSSVCKNSSSTSSSCSLEEISKLRKLRYLFISLFRMANDESEQKINGLDGFTASEELVSLKFFCRPFTLALDTQPIFDGIYTEEETERIVKIFNVALHPPSCVRYIQITFFYGRQFPQWLMSNRISSFLPNLTSLIIRDCRSCSQLPPLGKLPNLQELELVRLEAIMSIGVEFFGYEETSTSDGPGGSKSASCSLQLFPHLEHLRLVEIPNLEEWHWVPTDGRTVAMPQLKKLVVDCPKLLSLPEGLNRHATRLTELFVLSNTNLNSINEFTSVKVLGINGKTCPQIVSQLPALEVLIVNLDEEQSLSLPVWLVHSLPHLTSLHKLELTCKDKQLLCRCFQDATDLPNIKNIPIVEINEDESNYISYIKHSSTFETNLKTI